MFSRGVGTPNAGDGLVRSGTVRSRSGLDLPGLRSVIRVGDAFSVRSPSSCGSGTRHATVQRGVRRPSAPAVEGAEQQRQGPGRPPPESPRDARSAGASQPVSTQGREHFRIGCVPPPRLHGVHGGWAYGVQRAGHGAQRAGHGVQRAGHGVQRAGHGVQRAGHGVQRAGHGVQMAGHGVQMAGHDFGSRAAAQASRLLGEAALPASGSCPARVRVFEFYRAPSVRSRDRCRFLLLVPLVPRAAPPEPRGVSLAPAREPEGHTPKRARVSPRGIHIPAPPAVSWCSWSGLVRAHCMEFDLTKHVLYHAQPSVDAMPSPLWTPCPALCGHDQPSVDTMPSPLCPQPSTPCPALCGHHAQPSVHSAQPSVHHAQPLYTIPSPCTPFPALCHTLPIFPHSRAQISHLFSIFF
eukprot:gene6209-biopygen4347